MAKIVAALVGGVLLGVAGTWIVVNSDSGPDPADELVRDIGVAPQMTAEIAEAHREQRFEELTTIAEIFALPDSYTRSEALYTVAGRSSAADVQNLIFDAVRIADDYEREQALNVLFYRLTSLDPRSALALAQSEYFEGVRSVEQTVWRAWGRADLDEALFAARTQTSRTKQNLAAQALYAAFGMLGNETTDRIETELGIGPDRSTRARFIYRLADKSIEEAIAFIDGLDTVGAQNENISWLAYYLSLQDTAMAITYADLFERPSNRNQYKQLVESNAARDNPTLVLDRLLAGGVDSRSNNEFYAAARQLVRTDPDAALRYFEQTTSQQYRQSLGSLIVRQMAQDDPAAALAWARENDHVGGRPLLVATALSEIANTDPEFALDAAHNMENWGGRSMALSSVIETIAADDPAFAVTYLDRLTDPRQRQMASQNLALAWIRSDPEAAVEWTLSLDEETSANILRQAGYYVLRNNLDLAMSLLPRIDDASRRTWQTQIAQRLVGQRSIEEAQAFVRRFEGQPDHEAVQAAFISGVAGQDFQMAQLLADQISDVESRDSAYVQIVSNRAAGHPLDAVGLLGNISDESRRSRATGQIVRQWHRADPQAAQTWATNLPPGPGRDEAIVQMSQQWRNMTDEQVNLIEGISDRNKRGQAKIRRIYIVMQTDPARARELLQDQDIPDYMRQQAEVNLSQRGRGY